MARKNGGRNNALKHGAFAQDLILPDENEDDFEKLYQSLVAEWKPEGALEDDTVRTLAKCIWAKRRTERFYQREATWAEELPDEEALNHAVSVARALEGAETMQIASRILTTLPESYRSLLEEEVPMSIYGTHAETWIGRVKSCLRQLIDSRALTLAQTRRDTKFLAAQPARLRELTAKKIAMDERLEAMIDRAIKRLAQLKAFKQVIESQASQLKALEHRSDTDTPR